LALVKKLLMGILRHFVLRLTLQQKKGIQTQVGLSVRHNSLGYFSGF